MEAALLIKLLDLAYVGWTAYMRYQDAQQEVEPTLSDIRNLREKVLLGEVSPEEARKDIDLLLESSILRRREVISRL